MFCAEKRQALPTTSDADADAVNRHLVEETNRILAEIRSDPPLPLTERTPTDSLS
ncbi:Galactosyl transferase GMA12/MNN10 family protein [Actinidia rufa]|uniref:Galactosyl transferase GMA12/MNN10 family protein n=1 Tax=Actinidia rufa TaxID=165716 RepID=A0A7J0FH95_9ERIC|nr:Galactosyl transferase GMA12/MNN10 family protein [Actinidia rufa]